ncbi:hypothetical protein GCM10007989_36490 [Devosia pacifica]|uniref:non-specific protein-tyrosine kinase n=2 Tax=Devosia pacifica TaxID=1335967 RepID=A0A918SDF5_9HYPH|nr:hypothetical protein GCM10007989_36490 [Devosia pacifica]
MDLRRLMAGFGRHLKLITLFIVLGLSVAALGAAYQRPLYSATSLIIVDPTPQNLLSPQDRPPSGSESARVQSEVEILKSDSILLEVVDRLNLAADPEFAAEPWTARWIPALAQTSIDAPRMRALSRLKQRIRAERRGLTNILAVSSLAMSPDRAAVLANTTVDAYLAQQISAKTESLARAEQMMNARIEAVRASLANATGEDRSVLSRQLGALQARGRDLRDLAGLQMAHSNVVSAAIAPLTPSQPNVLAWLAEGCLVGLGSGCLLAYLREAWTGGMYSEDDAERHLGLPAIGAIPHVTLPAGSEGPSEEILERPLGGYANAIRILRANLQHQTGTAGALVATLTSSRQGEGKTTAALSLARSFAMAGRKVLLIDCDLRSTGTGRIAPSRPGLAAYLRASGEIDLNRLIIRDGVSGAAILPAGEPLPPYEVDRVIVSAALVELIAAARESFDVVLLDSAALDNAADAMYLAPLSDALLFLTRWADTPHRLARRHLMRLVAAAGTEAKVFVAVSQQVEAKKPADLYNLAGFFAAPERRSVTR